MVMVMGSNPGNGKSYYSIKMWDLKRVNDISSQKETNQILSVDYFEIYSLLDSCSMYMRTG